MITPNTWLLNVLFQTYREFLFKDGGLIAVRNYRYPVFPEAVVDTSVVTFRPKSLPLERVVVDHVLRTEEIRHYEIDRKFLETLNDLHIPLLSDLGLAAAIAVPVYEVSVKLTEIAEIIQGCKPFQVGKGDPLQTREIVETQPFVADYRKDKTFRPLLRGSLIDRYTILWDGDYWISFGDWLAEPRYSANFDATEKIFVRQTGDSLVATLDTSQFIGRDNLYVIHSKTSEISLLWLLAILNSRLLNQIYHLLKALQTGVSQASTT